MRISDWSSDVCSSDLYAPVRAFSSAGQGSAPADAALQQKRRMSRRTPLKRPPHRRRPRPRTVDRIGGPVERQRREAVAGAGRRGEAEDRKSVVSGKSVSVRVDLGGRRILKKTSKSTYTTTLSQLQHCHRANHNCIEIVHT